MSSLDNTAFCQLWKSLYEPATVLASHNVKEDDLKLELLELHRENVVAILSGMTKIVFGVDEHKKAFCVWYGIGCLELTMKLIESCQLSLPLDPDSQVVQPPQTEQEQDVWRSGLKMCKCLVVKSKMGRTKCREAGIFTFMAKTLHLFLHEEGNASMVEEALTTLAAICLGDDMNALQAAVQLRHYVDRASLRFPNHEGMHQKIHYLTVLFDVMEQEQASLMNKMEDNFFDKVAFVESELTRGTEAQRQEEYEESQQHYTSGLEELQSMPNDTGLLDSLWCQLLEQSAVVKLKLCDWDGALQHVHAILEFNNKNTPPQVLMLKAKALEGMGKVNEAKETLYTAIVANPHDEALLCHLERLNVE
jgi:tetratricopeptide (TPR) repeat protein